MTPVWHDGPLAALAPGSDAVSWSVDLRVDPGVKAHAEDLADAATGRDGAARLARRLLARALVARVAGCAPDAVGIGRTARGAPHVAGPEGWHVSLSGRSDRALIGVARVPIGVDREPLVGHDVLWDTLTARETAALRALPAVERSTAWLQRWTIKEAHAKLIGEPRRIAPEAIETRLDGEGRGGASLEGRSEAWMRVAHGGLETIATWDRRSVPPI